MLALSGLVTAANLVLSLVVGVRLLRPAADVPLGRGLGLYFVLSAFLATIAQLVVYGSLAEPSLALAQGLERGLLGFATAGMSAGAAGIYLFTWRTFRPEARWAALLCALGAAVMLAGFWIEAVTARFSLAALPGLGYWLSWVGRTTAPLWVAIESLLYWRRMRRRLRLGLADAVLVNRFMLWAVWSCTAFLNFAAAVVARVFYFASGASAEQVDLQVAGPIVVVTVSVTMLLGIVSAVTLFLTFFPTPAYRRWITARAEREATASP